MMSTSKPFFSIIIPVYDVEKYLLQCLQSVFIQTFQDFEIIAVNDGSKDNSLEILSKTLLPSALIINQENRGLSAARNIGAKNSRGNYLIFLDSDDYWDNSNFLYKLKQNLEKYNFPDLALWGLKKYYEKTRKIKNYHLKETSIKLIDSIFLKNQLLISNNYHASAVNKTIKRDFYYDNRFSFPESIFSEDVEWSYNLLERANTILMTDLNPYVYRQRIGSITKTIKIKNINDLLFNLVGIYNSHMIDKDKSKIYSRIFLGNQVFNFFLVLRKINILTSLKIIKKNLSLFYFIKFSTSKRLFSKIIINSPVSIVSLSVSLTFLRLMYIFIKK
jgi:glycosyltransferase involved in cell wall biosynthesis